MDGRFRLAMVSHLPNGQEITFYFSPITGELTVPDDHVASALGRCFWQGFALEIVSMSDADVPWKTVWNERPWDDAARRQVSA